MSPDYSDCYFWIMAERSQVPLIYYQLRDQTTLHPDLGDNEATPLLQRNHFSAGRPHLSAAKHTPDSYKVPDIADLPI